jgi:hypothetical protein
MKTIESIVRSIQKELTPQFEQRLRSQLMEQDKEWLIEQIIRLTLDAHSLHEMDRRTMQEIKARQMAERLARVKALALDQAKLRAFIERYQPYQRERLIAEGYLLPEAPAKGTALITDAHRTDRGHRLLTEAKDCLYALLFGDEATHTRFQRVQQELLTIAVPRFKAGVLDFMKATTELSAHGTWQDPEEVSTDLRADNTLLQVEYGEVAGEWIGHGIVVTLSLINNLEVNEQVLYARMENVEQSTLIS